MNSMEAGVKEDVLEGDLFVDHPWKQKASNAFGGNMLVSEKIYIHFHCMLKDHLNKIVNNIQKTILP